MVCLAPVAALCLLPAADQARGPVTTAGDCEPPERGVEPPPMTGERAFVCAVRTSGALPSARRIPGLALVAYGRRLCGVHTRNDPEEVSRVRETGVDVRTLDATLAGIRPSAAIDGFADAVSGGGGADGEAAGQAGAGVAVAQGGRQRRGLPGRN